MKKYIIAFLISLILLVLLELMSKYIFEISDFTIGWMSCAGFCAYLFNK